MSNAFAYNMTALRRQKGVTQKAAAEQLGISQSLLSHYEKGLRACSLDFLLRASAFYGVSCDRLLRPPEEAADPLPPEEAQLLAAVHIVFDSLKGEAGEALRGPAYRFMAMACYRLFRLLYAGGEQGEDFTCSPYAYRALADAAMQVSEAKLSCLLAGEGGAPPVQAEALTAGFAGLAEHYPQEFPRLVRLLHEAEQEMKER